jgi:hypothetical protein
LRRSTTSAHLTSEATISEDRHLKLTIVVSGSSINLACLAYPNNTFPTML